MKEFSGRVVDDVRELRNALATFATGVTVVTTRDDGGSPQGFTANSFTSVSLNPPLILVCIARSANCFPIFSVCKQFAVNILHEEQRAVSDVFATGTGDRFSAIDWQWSALQNPLLRGVVSWLDCRAVTREVVSFHLDVAWLQGPRLEIVLRSWSYSIAFCSFVSIGVGVRENGRDINNYQQTTNTNTYQEISTQVKTY